MKTLSIIFLTLLCISLFSCEEEELSTVITTESRDLDHFSKLEIEGIGSAELIPSEEFKIEITTHVDLLHDIRTRVYDDKLLVELTGRHKEIKRLDYKIYAPSYSEIKLDAVGDISCYDGFETDHLTVIQDNVGKIVLRNIVANSIYAHLDDVGDIVLSGVANDVNYKLDGVGSIKAFDLEAKTGEADLDGVGDIEIYATDDLTIKHDGVGKVYYKGSPDIHYSGHSGNVVHR